MITCSRCGHPVDRCSHCGQPIDYEAQLDDDRLQITLAAVRKLQRNTGRGTVSTVAVAVEISYSTRWSLEWLKRLEALDLIHRPRGPKSGWATVRPQLTIVKMAA